MDLKKYFSILMLLASLILCQTSFAQTLTIVATVNDKAITNYALESRIAMIAMTSNTNLTEETHRAIRPTALRNLMNETLMQQELKFAGIEVSEEIINKEISNIEKRNGMEPGGLKKLFKENNIAFKTFLNKIRTEIGWTMLISSRFSNDIQITDFEIDNNLSMLKARDSKTLYQVSEILLPIKEGVDKAINLAGSLRKEIINGASFKVLAEVMSVGITAKQGGELGWVAQEDIPAELWDTILGMSTNEISQPIISRFGVHLINLKDKKDGLDIIIPSREQINENLFKEKIELAAKNYLKQIQDDAIVDIKQ